MTSMLPPPDRTDVRPDLPTGDGQELRKPQDWARAHGTVILDPDGWREPGAPSFEEPCTHDEFLRRLPTCTVGNLTMMGLPTQ